MNKKAVAQAAFITVILVVSSILFFMNVKTQALLNSPVPQTQNNNQGTPPPTNNTNPPPTGNINFSNPLGLGQKETLLYGEYLTRFVAPTGAAISNVVPVSWCSPPNPCIGCNGDVTSEAVGRSLAFSAMSKDKPITDRYTSYYMLTMRHPGTGHMMWKLNNDGSIATGCGGQNSAVDGELEAIEGLSVARRTWSTDARGISYLQMERDLMDSLKDGFIQTPYGQTLPFCLYPTSNDPATAKGLPCGDVNGLPTVYTGYLDLRAMKDACLLDSAWCNTYTGSKAVLKAAVQNQNGVYVLYTAYQTGDNTWQRRESFIHSLWVIKHLIEDGSTDAVQAAQPLYDQSRTLFYQTGGGNGGLICEQWEPTTGCKQGSRIGAYSEWLEMAVAKRDTTFVNDLIKVIFAKCAQDQLGEGTVLCSPDNYGNIVVLQAFADARLAGYTVG